MKNIKVLQPIPLTKRILYYVLLIGITLLGLFFALFLGGRGHKIVFYVICMYLIPQCVFGLIFLKTKWIFKLVVPLLTSIVSFGCFRLINLDNMTDFEAFAYLIFPSIVFVWESAYQILKIKNTEENMKNKETELETQNNLPLVRKRGIAKIARMKMVTLIIFISLLFASCMNSKDKVITTIDCNGIQGKPEYMLFKTENEGYMFCYKGGLYQNSTIFIYKTTNGGKDWEQIYFADSCFFYGYAELCNNAIFGNIKSSEDVAKNNLFKLDLTTQEFKLLNFNIEAIGNIWAKNNNICISFSNKNPSTNKWESNILFIDTDFHSYSVIPFYYSETGEDVISDSTNTYFITKNQLIIETNGTYKEIEIKEPTCITKIAENKVLIATNEQENAISLYQYDLTSDKLEKLQTFEKYSIIGGLQSNENVIVCFVGTKTYFPIYDLIYSTDEGQTWHIQKLKELMVEPNCLVDNILYFYSLGTLQKVTF